MALEKFSPPGKWFLKLTLQIKWSTPSESASKRVHKNDVVSCVHFCSRSLGLLERCEEPNSSDGGFGLNNVTYQFTQAGNGWDVEGSASAEILDPIVRGQTLTGGALILTHVGLQFSSGLLAERQFGSGASQVSDYLHKKTVPSEYIKRNTKQ